VSEGLDMHWIFLLVFYGCSSLMQHVTFFCLFLASKIITLHKVHNFFMEKTLFILLFLFIISLIPSINAMKRVKKEELTQKTGGEIVIKDNLKTDSLIRALNDGNLVQFFQAYTKQISKLPIEIRVNESHYYLVCFN
jgi:hypothetical protein